MKVVYAKLEKQFGVKIATRYKYNAKAILKDDDIEQSHIIPIKKKRKFFGLY